MSSLLTSLHAQLSAVAAGANTSLSALARGGGASKSRLCAVLRGERAPTWDGLCELARALDIEITITPRAVIVTRRPVAEAAA